jgi:hypothetical protein
MLFSTGNHFDFYSCNYMRFEILKHWTRLKSISKMSEDQLQISYSHVLSKLKFINEETMPIEI